MTCLRSNSEVIQFNKEQEGTLSGLTVLVDHNPQFMPGVIERAESSLKLIITASTGYDHIPEYILRQRKIIVCNIPEYSTISVAEHTIGLMLAAARQYGVSYEVRQNGKWSDRPEGREMKGKTLGVIGLGKIGTAVRRIAENGFQMRVLAVDSHSSQGDWGKLLEESDFISIHTPLNSKTMGLIGRREFEQMKVGVILVNTSRAGILDEDALLVYLDNGKV